MTYWSIKLNSSEQRKNLADFSLEAINFINDLIRYDPDERPAVLDLPAHRYFRADLKTS